MSKENLTYNKYLKVEELLSLQRPLSKPAVPNETLFILVHQVYELWFKQVLSDLETLTNRIAEDNIVMSLRILDRIGRIFRVLIQQVEILETMTPVEYIEFRGELGTASGFQSLQFRMVELAAGAEPIDYEPLAKHEPEWHAAVAKYQDRPSLRDAFFDLLKRHKYLSGESSDEKVNAVVKVYHDKKASELHLLCEALLNFDETLSLWRFRHVQMVERIIGMNRGTSGSLGVSYLQTTIKKRFMNELWTARTKLCSP